MGLLSRRVFDRGFPICNEHTAMMQPFPVVSEQQIKWSKY